MKLTTWQRILQTLCLTVLLGLSPLVAGKPAEGRWIGAIELPGSRLDVAVALTHADGGWSGTIDIPAQGASELPLSGIEIDGKAVRFSIAGVPGEPTFEGTVKGGKLAGDFTQGGQRFDFSMEPAGAAVEPAAADESGVGEPLWLETERGRIHGTLTLPQADGPVPVVLIVAGSGPTDRDGNNPLIPGKNDSLKMIARELSTRSIASLRYDKRGIAGSAAAGIAEPDLRFGDFVDDARRWIRMLREDDRFSRVIVLGHSEGSLIGMLAAGEGRADGCISIAGAGRVAYEVIESQIAAQPKAMRDESERVLAELRAGRTVEDVDPDLAALYRPSIQPYLISWFEHDPAEAIAGLKIPVLIVQGGTDIQVPVSEAERLRAARPDASFALFEGMNHVLKDAPAERQANIAAYSDPTLPLSDGLVDALAEFVGKIKPAGGKS